MYRGKKKKVEDLSPTGNYKVDVQCPECYEIRNVYYRSICAAGHTVCQKCSVKLKMAKILKAGDRFDKLTVIGPSKKSGYSIFKCECGEITEKNNWNVTSGKTTSCGCLRSDNMKKIATHPLREEHWHWKGGISGERCIDMQHKEYKDWRTSVFERDKYTCQKCGQVGYEIRAHHTYNYADYPELRTDVDNGITLCDACHREFHNINRNKTNKTQLDIFLQPYCDKYHRGVIKGESIQQSKSYNGGGA